MQKKITDTQRAELEGNMQTLLDDGQDENTVREYRDKWINKFGTDEVETTTVKKKGGAQNYVVSPSNIPSQSTENLPSNGSLGVNDFYPKGFAPEPIEVNKAVAKAKTQEKVEKLVKSYRNNKYLNQEISDEDLTKTIGGKLEKNPNVGDDILHSILSKEHRDKKIANTSLEGFNQIGVEVNQMIDAPDKAEYEQSRTGKVVRNLNNLTSGNGLDYTDAEYTYSVAPVAYNQALNGMNLVEANAFYKAQAQKQDVEQKGQQLKNQVNYVSSQTGIPIEGLAPILGVEGAGVDNLIQSQKAKEQAEKDALSQAYPVVRDEIGRPIYGSIFDSRYEGNPEAKKKLAEIEQKYSNFRISLGNSNATAYAYKNIENVQKNTISIEDIGRESYKIQNPEQYQSFISAGQISSEVKAQMWQLGIYAMKASNQPELVKKALEEEPKYYAIHPKKLHDETIRRLSTEYYQQKGLNSFYNSPFASTTDLDKIADNLPKEFKDEYYRIRKNAIEQKSSNSFNPNAKSEIGTIQLMNPKGGVNSFFEGGIGTIKSEVKSIGDLVGVRSKAQRINENLEGQPIEEQYPFGSNDDIEKEKEALKAKAKDKKLTPQEAQRFTDLEAQDKAIPRGYDHTNSITSTGGLVTAMILTTKGISAGLQPVVGAVTRVGTTIEGLSTSASTFTNMGEVATTLQNASNGIVTATNAEQVANVVSKIKGISDNASGMISMGLMTYDDASKRSLELMPNDNQSGARSLYTISRTAMWASLSRIFPFEKLTQAFTPEIEGKLSKLAQQMAKGELDKTAYATKLEGIRSELGNYFKNAGLDAIKVTGEMTGGTAGNAVMDYIANPNAFNSEQQGEAVLHTLTHTWIDMLPMIALGGVKPNANYKVGVSVLSNIFTEKGATQYKEVNEALVQKGDLTREQADENSVIVNQARLIEDISMKDARSIKPLSKKEDDLYKIHLLREQILQKQIEGKQKEPTKDVVFIGKAEKAIVESQKIREGIIDGKYVIDDQNNLIPFEEKQDEIAKQAQEEELLKTQKDEATNTETKDSEITANVGGTDLKAQPETVSETTGNAPTVEVATLGEKEREDLINGLSIEQRQEFAVLDEDKDKENTFLQGIVDGQQKVGDGSDAPKVVVTEPTPTEKSEPLPMAKDVSQIRENWNKETYDKYVEDLTAKKGTDEFLDKTLDNLIEKAQTELKERTAEIKTEPTLNTEISDLEKERDAKVKELDLHLDFLDNEKELKENTNSGKQTKISSRGKVGERPEQKIDVQNEIKAKQEILKRIKKCL